MKHPAILLFVCAVAATSHAARPIEPGHDSIDHGSVSLYIENDLFGGTDRYYTSGVKLSWTSTDLEKFADTPYASPLLPLLDRMPFLNRQGFQKNLTFSLGQNIYTPDDTESSGLVEDDRPYAGWLYLGVGVAWKNAAERHALTLQIGIVGSWSLGEESQRGVHEARGLGSPQGWDNQLSNELGVNLAYLRTWRYPHKSERVGLGWELLPHAGATVGNVHIFANAGAELRVGFNLPDDFGTASISPAESTPTAVEGEQQARRPRVFDLGAYVFLKADGKVVGRNLFLDGNTFADSHSVDKKWLVAEISAGASVNYKNTKLTYALIYRTIEFDGQEEGQLFGSVTVNVAF